MLGVFSAENLGPHTVHQLARDFFGATSGVMRPEELYGREDAQGVTEGSRVSHVWIACADDHVPHLLPEKGHPDDKYVRLVFFAGLEQRVCSVEVDLDAFQIAGAEAACRELLGRFEERLEKFDEALAEDHILMQKRARLQEHLDRWGISWIENDAEIDSYLEEFPRTEAFIQRHLDPDEDFTDLVTHVFDISDPEGEYQMSMAEMARSGFFDAVEAMAARLFGVEREYDQNNSEE